MVQGWQHYQGWKLEAPALLVLKDARWKVEEGTSSPSASPRGNRTRIRRKSNILPIEGKLGFNQLPIANLRWLTHGIYLTQGPTSKAKQSAVRTLPRRLSTLNSTRCRGRNSSALNGWKGFTTRAGQPCLRWSHVLSALTVQRGPQWILDYPESD